MQAAVRSSRFVAALVLAPAIACVASTSPPPVGSGVEPAAWTRIVESRRPVDGDPVELDFKERSVLEIVPFIAEATGKAVLVRTTQVQPTKITVQSAGPLSRGEALDRVYEALASNFIAVVEDERVVWLDLLAEIPRSPRPLLFVGPEEDVSTVPCNGVLTLTVLAVQHGQVEVLAAKAREFLPAHCTLTFDSDSRQIVLSGTVAAAKQAQRLTRSLDRPAVCAGGTAAGTRQAVPDASKEDRAARYQPLSDQAIGGLSRLAAKERLAEVAKLLQEPGIGEEAATMMKREYEQLIGRLKEVGSR